MVHYLLRFVLLFTSDAFGSSVRRLKALRLDMGRSFSSSVTVKERCAFQFWIISQFSTIRALSHMYLLWFLLLSA